MGFEESKELPLAADMDMIIAIDRIIPREIELRLKYKMKVAKWLESRGFEVNDDRLIGLLRKKSII